MLTSKHVYRADPTFKVNPARTLPLANIQKLVVSPHRDNCLLIKSDLEGRDIVISVGGTTDNHREHTCSSLLAVSR